MMAVVIRGAGGYEVLVRRFWNERGLSFMAKTAQECVDYLTDQYPGIPTHWNI